MSRYHVPRGRSTSWPRHRRDQAHRDALKAGLHVGWVPHRSRTAAAREADIAEAVRDRGLRPRVPAALPADLRPLMEQCWATEPDDRPNFRDIAKRLREACVRQDTLVPTTTTKLPLGPEARGSESSSVNSFDGTEPLKKRYP